MHRYRHHTIALVTLLTLGLSGCSLMPAEHTTDSASLPDSFSQTGQHSFSEQWWHEFEDPQLNLLIEEALTSNFTIQSALARQEQAAAQANVTQAGLYPNVTGNAGQSYRRNQQQNGNINKNESFDVGISTRWEIDLWGRMRHRSDAAMYDYLASSEALQSAAISLAGNIARTWYQLSEQSARVDILSRQLTNIEHITEVTNLRYTSGQGSVSAIWRQEQIAESTRASHLQAVKRQEILTRQLNVLLGKPPASKPRWQVSAFPTLPALPSTGIPANLVETRPDIRDRWYQYQARRHQVAEARAARIPSFMISAGTDTSGDQLEDLFDFWATDFALSLNVPIFRGGQLKSQQRRAEAISTRAFYDYTQTVLNALREVETNLLEEQSQQEQLASLQEQTRSAQKILDVESARYATGIQRYLDVLNAQERLFNLQLRSLAAERQLMERRINLYQSLGGSLLNIDDNGELMIQMPITKEEQLQEAV
ncbi:TolC family protein [Endozoicomonas lisbonensis]|uniref:Multidrug efflux system outer membrane protein n=1 Tax=Endozoicomonas lisbonensis TaxID=3120522 RepID=A0ABV2SF19_9GAMM